MHCEDDKPYYPITSGDLAFGVVVVIFVFLLIFSTFYEGLARYKTEEEYDRITSSTCMIFVFLFR